MKVTIDIKVLMQVIQRFNPNADLTGLKAHLFDLVINGGVDAPTPRAFKQPSAPVEEVPTFHFQEDSPFAPETPLTGEGIEIEEVGGQEAPEISKLADQMMTNMAAPARVAVGKAPAGHVSINKKLSPKEKLAQRELKRQERNRFEGKSGKEIMQELTAAKEAKRGDNNQFTNLGSDGDDGGNDVDAIG